MLFMIAGSQVGRKAQTCVKLMDFLFILFPDTYDALLAVGCLGPNHVNHDCFESLAAITKPGK